jgi:hypothetical protein
MRTALDVIVLLLAFRGDDAGTGTGTRSTERQPPLVHSVVASHEQRYDEETAYAFHWDELLLAEHRERVVEFRDRRKNWSRKRYAGLVNTSLRTVSFLT